MRFEAQARGYTVITGEDEADPAGPKGMWPGELFVAALGMCIAGYVASFCKNHGTAYEGMTVELTRERARNPSRVKEVRVTVRLPGLPSEQEQKAIIRAAELCHVTQSIVHGMKVSVSLGSQSE
jgi:uncharacterized OsmC-like protein